jgi:hypothetical protein
MDLKNGFSTSAAESGPFRACSKNVYWRGLVIPK